MAKNDQNIFQFDAELSEDGTIRIPDLVINQLKEKDSSGYTISISPNSGEVLNKLNIPPNVVEQIQNVQELPKNIVAEFFQSKSSITDKSFLKRIEAYA